MRLEPVCEVLFSSFDGHDAVGGWAVKQSRGDDQLMELLVGRIRTTMPPTHDLPAFPTAAELDRASRRLVYRRLPGGHSALWHTFPAGRDASGRPGNVMVHAVMTSAVTSMQTRAVDWWRSPAWATPHGPSAVAAAALPEASLWVPGPLASVEPIVTFLFPRHPEPIRTNLLDRLLDVIAAGRQVALLVSDADETARWLAALCAFTSPPLARRLSFSTWEDAGDLALPGVADLDVVGVRRGSQLPVGAGGRVVIDASEDPEPDGESWVLRSGQRVSESPWSGLAAHSHEEGRDMVSRTLLALRDNDVGGWVGTDFAEPLARLAGTHESSRGDLNHHCVEAFGRARRDPAHVADYVTDVVVTGVWMLGDDPPPVLTLDEAQRHMVTESTRNGEIRQRLDRLAADLEGLPAGEPTSELVGQGLVGLRTIDFLSRCGVPLRSSTLLRAVADALASPGGDEIAERHGPLETDAVRAGLRPWVSTRADVSADVLAWLGLDIEPATPAPPTPALSQEPVEPSPDPTPRAQAWHRLRPWGRRPSRPSEPDPLVEASHDLVRKSHQWDLTDSAGRGTSQAQLRAESLLARHRIDPMVVLAEADDDPDRLRAVAILAMHRSGAMSIESRDQRSSDELVVAADHLLRTSSPTDELLRHYAVDVVYAAMVLDADKRHAGTAAMQTATTLVERFPDVRPELERLASSAPFSNYRGTRTYNAVLGTRTRRGGGVR